MGGFFLRKTKVPNECKRRSLNTKPIKLRKSIHLRLITHLLGTKIRRLFNTAARFLRVNVRRRNEKGA